VSRYTLGVDTSNYATSLAVFDTAGEVVCAKKRFLPVKAGQLGLRQSDALFHHTAALPEMLQELAQEFDLTKIDAVGVSQKPRPVEGSYMPCFLAGVSAATAFAAARDGLYKTIQNAIDGSCAPGLFPLVSIPTIVGCVGALLIIIAAIATPIAKTQHAREIWFYMMSGGAVLKIVTMEIARIIL